MAKELEFSTTDIEKKFGIARNRIKEWVPKFVKPSIEEARGQGTRNRYSRFDVLKILVLKFIIEHGFQRREAAQRLEVFSQSHFETVGVDIDAVKYIGFTIRSKGKFALGYLAEPGVNKPSAVKNPDFFTANDLSELTKELNEWGLTRNDIEGVVVVNFEIIRNLVDKNIL